METSSFFNSVERDRVYGAEAFALYHKLFLTTGVYHTDNVPALLVKRGTGLKSIVEPGSAFIEGYMYNSDSNKELTHDVGDVTNPRIDRIVVRLDLSLSGRTIKSWVKKGIPATNPQPPALQRDASVYEISLAQVRVNANGTSITSITDERLNRSVAGLVSSLITVPTEEFQRQWEEWFQKIQVENPAMGGMTISVGPTKPANPSINDLHFPTV